MNWVRAARSTYIGIERYKQEHRLQNWTVIDTLRLTTTIRQELARLAWAAENPPANRPVSREDFKAARIIAVPKERS